MTAHRTQDPEESPQARTGAQDAALLADQMKDAAIGGFDQSPHKATRWLAAEVRALRLTLAPLDKPVTISPEAIGGASGNEGLSSSLVPLHTLDVGDWFTEEATSTLWCVESGEVRHVRSETLKVDHGILARSRDSRRRVFTRDILVRPVDDDPVTDPDVIVHLVGDHKRPKFNEAGERVCGRCGDTNAAIHARGERWVKWDPTCPRRVSP